VYHRSPVTRVRPRCTLSHALEASRDASVFVRVHRSFVVRLDRIRTLEPYGKNDHVAILADGTRVPVSREGYARLRELLE
jgi:two-component system, LytTR family, response regulator